MKLAALQLDLAWLDPEENLRRAEALGERAVQEGARLVILPEMFSTGFSMDAARTAAAGPRTAEFLGRIAARWKVHVVGGFVEPGEPRPFNVSAVFGPDGRELRRYRKIHPFRLAGEDRQYAAGDALVGLEVEGVRCTLFVCYDLRFPEIFRAAADSTDLFVVIANWPERRGDAWSALLRARAIENLCYVVGVNRVGEGDGLRYRGDSAIVDPLGRTLAERADESAPLLAEVVPSEVARVRRELGFLDDRRPAVYERLRAPAGSDQRR